MPTAAELLNGNSLQPNPEGHIVVGGDRFITIPENLKRLGVQNDHNMETVTFDCPRYWDERDMSKMAIYIPYMLSNGYKDRYPVDNVRVDGDIMHFDWTISKNVTQVAGVVSFLVCIMKTDADGNEERHWNSELSQEAYVSPGMECEESPIDIYPDLVTQLLLRMNTVEQINVQAEEMNQILADAQETAAAAEETKNQALDASNYIKNSYAPAIKNNVSGEIIQVNDVSPIEHDVKCLVHGKNLVNPNNILRSLSVNLSYTEPELHIVKTNETEKWSNIYIGIGVYEEFVGKTLTLSLDNMGAYTWSVLLAGTTAKGELVREVGGGSAKTGHLHFTMTIPEMPDAELLAIRIVSGDNKVTTGEESILKNIQVEEGSVATDYEPYIDPATATLTSCGKNLAYRNTINISGTVGTSGAIGSLSNSILVKDIPIKKDVTYIISMSKPAELTTPRVFLYNGLLNGLTHTATYNELVPQGRGVEKVALNGAIVNTNGYEYMAITIGGTSAFSQGDSINVTVSNLQLEIGNAATSYEPYSGSTVIPTSDGTCVVTSKSPTMTLFTDIPGVTIEAEYNVDTEKYIEERIQTAVNAWLTAHYADD